VREVALGAYAHQELPFETLVAELRPERDTSHNPLFQVVFMLQNAPVGGMELPSLKLKPVETHLAAAKLDLTLVVEEGTEGLEGTVRYNTDLFEEGTIGRMVGHFRRLLEEIAADPTKRFRRCRC